MEDEDSDRGLSDKVVEGFQDIAPVLPGDNSRKKEKESARSADGTSKLRSAEDGAVKSSSNKVSSEKAGGFYTGQGKPATSAGGGKGAAVANAASNSKGKAGMIKKAAPLIAVGAIVSILIIVLTIGYPMFMIASIDYNLQDALGFSDTTAILEEQAEHVTAEQMARGEVPAAYAEALAEHGIEVGQVTVAGDFVRTNTYIADIDDTAEIAANGYYRNNDNGELVMLFDNQVITADNFVMAVESNPKMYAAYSEAADISARYYYSDEVSEVYKDLGVSRNAFGSWEYTGSSSEDMENFYKTLSDVLDNDSAVKVNGYESDSNEFSTSVSGDDAEKIVNEVSDGTTGNNATSKAAQLLNTAISSSEPYKAASAFVAVEEPIQRARIDGNGPVNELMNTLTIPNEVSYTDVDTKETVTKKKSILDTQNFVAATSGGVYSQNEAANFSRDRVLNVTETANSAVMDDTTVSTDGQSKSNIVLGISAGNGADKDVMNKTTSSVAIAVTDDDTKLFTSVVGGNRVVEGGSFLSNSINSRVIAAMPSDAGTIAEYHREVETVMARKAEAERATLSPFDISSPNTFLGSIFYGLGAIMIRNSGSNFTSSIDTVVGLADKSVAGIIGSVRADGKDNTFTTMSGSCDTVKNAANVEGDLYCTSHNTVSTDYINYTKEDWENVGVVDSNGGLSDDMKEFVTLGMDREATVGIKSAEVCEQYKKLYPNIVQIVVDGVTTIAGLYNACNIVVTHNNDNKDDIALASKYTLSSSNSNYDDMEKYSGYALYDTVSSLLEDKKSSVAAFKEEYYREHPKDTSAAGIMARRSGMSKDEAQIALNYASYLDRIARYDASNRYAFKRPAIEIKKEDLLVEHSDTVQVSLYCVRRIETEYADVRNRSFAA